MFFTAESITCFYDLEQDRLHLTFSGTDREEITGVMTRQFLKELLAQLPSWLIQQYADEMPQPPGQQSMISSFHHHLSQQQVPVTYGKTTPGNHIETFLIHSVNLIKNKRTAGQSNEKIKLAFLDRDHATEIGIGFTLEQLHKLIGEILKQVQNWDLPNPWLADTDFFVSPNAKNNSVH